MLASHAIHSYVKWIDYSTNNTGGVCILILIDNISVFFGIYISIQKSNIGEVVSRIYKNTNVHLRKT